MLYELIAVVRPGSLNEIKEIARTTGNIVLNSGGVVRGITNWGVFLLPKRVVVHQAAHHSGHYFIMRFDSTGKTQETIRRTLGLDPRMIRHSIVKLDKNPLAAHIGGKVEWRKGEDEWKERLGLAALRRF